MFNVCCDTLISSFSSFCVFLLIFSFVLVLFICGCYPIERVELVESQTEKDGEGKHSQESGGGRFVTVAMRGKGP